MNSVTKKALLAVAVVAALAGCGSTAEPAQPSATGQAAPKDKKQRLEAGKADCMKQKGFKYVAYVQPEKQQTADELKRLNGDYAAMRAYREKYGFGAFALLVYPKEMGSPAVKPDSPDINPNWGIQSKLSKSQMDAYRKASDVCFVDAAKQVLGLTLKSDMDYYTQIHKATERAVKARIDSEPKLVELASAMATCLKGKGYSIGKTTPQALSGRGLEVFLKEQDKLGRAERDDVADVAPPAKDGEMPMTYVPTLTPAQAKPYLAREIKAALDDLECGKDFYRAFSPIEQEIGEKVNAEYGM